MLRYLTAGESHGASLTTILDGLPAGLTLKTGYIDLHLGRRQGGYGRGGRMGIEHDFIRITSGVRGELTTGAPVTMVITNADWDNWSQTMATGPEADLNDRVITRPRPGHADLTGAIKYGHQDVRNVLERSSARETASRVAAGSVARMFLEALGVFVVGHVIQIGSVKAEPNSLDFSELESAVFKSQVYCADPKASEAMIDEISLVRTAGDSLGGVFEIKVFGLPPGLGSYSQRNRTLDGRLAGALMSIQAIKGVEIGAGFAAASARGSQLHDGIQFHYSRGFFRETNNAGGIEGGMSNGNELVIKAAMKPIPTLNTPLYTVDIKTKMPVGAAVERSDICAVPAACVVGESAVAWEIAVAFFEKFGGDTMDEIKKRVEDYREYVNHI